MTEFRPERLLFAARAATGLEDFGDPSFREGLDVLCEALPQGSLSELGQQAWQGQLHNYLCQRLQIEDWYRRHPELERVPIEAPVFVMGLPRTGTTALSNLLAADPAARSLRTWESAQPTPPPETATEHSDPRIAIADAGLAGIKQLAPELAKMHDDTGSSPTENHDLLGMHFRTHHFEGQTELPSYTRWWLGCDMQPAYRHHRRVLKLLQWRCGPTRWNLKNPPDLANLPAVRAVYPDLKWIWTHRDPAKVLPSVCSLIATVRGAFSDSVDRKAIGRGQLAFWSECMRRALAYRDEIGDAAFADLRMQELVARPLPTLGALYEQLGLPFTRAAEQRMRAWLEENPQGRHGAHAPVLEDYGLDVAAIRAAFRDYTDRFAIQIEL